eukprot:m.59654 g.59654  ORF g.59654 m.59654 type:complete len:58 (-) comp13240_c0_seq1:1242-1415(-)
MAKPPLYNDISNTMKGAPTTLRSWKQKIHKALYFYITAFAEVIFFGGGGVKEEEEFH